MQLLTSFWMKSNCLTPRSIIEYWVILFLFHNFYISLHVQIWNHDFFWQSMKPDGGGQPSGDLLKLIERDFGSYEAFFTNFKSAAATQFGSGWAWLVCEWFLRLKDFISR